MRVPSTVLSGVRTRRGHGLQTSARSIGDLKGLRSPPQARTLIVMKDGVLEVKLPVAWEADGRSHEGFLCIQLGDKVQVGGRWGDARIVLPDGKELVGVRSDLLPFAEALGSYIKYTR